MKRIIFLMCLMFCCLSTNVFSNDEQDMLLLEAVIIDNFLGVSNLLYQGANPNSVPTGIPILTMAGELASKDVLKVLVEHGANVNHVSDNYHSALGKSVSSGRVDNVMFLLEQGAFADVYVNDEQRTVLMLASSREEYESVRVLLKSGADVNALTYQSKTALMEAAENNHFENVGILMEAGADISMTNSDQLSAMDFAKQNKHYKIFYYLKKILDRQ